MKSTERSGGSPSVRRRSWFAIPALLVPALALTAFVSQSERFQGREAPSSVLAMRLAQPLEKDGVSATDIARGLPAASGLQQIIVRLRTPAAASPAVSPAARLRHEVELEREQDDFVGRCLRAIPGAREIARVQLVLNAVFLEVDASAIPAIASDPAVLHVRPVGHYDLLLDETVPYIGAELLQQVRGLDGEGVRVAVLDSGIDYTHADLGGSGDPADYAANDPTIIEPGTFPTDRVVGGFDFLGNVWPTGPGGFGDPPMPDPDPLDDLALVPGSFAGHGTHVADIIGGARGVAPGVDFYAVKVCASLTPSCNGIALIQGMEFAVDPDGDGDPSDHVDIINMSLGASYGQPFDDDLAAAVDNATDLGVLTVSAAGNCGDRPYCTGTPAAAETALSVAQTEVPSAVAFAMNVVEPKAQAGLKNAVLYPWTPAPAGLIEGLVQYGDDGGTNLNGCAPFLGDLTGKIVAVDRGACFFSDKIRNIENAGGALGIVMLVAPGAPFPGGFGGGAPINIPGFNISQADGDIIRSAATNPPGGPTTAFVQFGPMFSSPLVGTTVSSTARGPDMSFNKIKPEIGAPGASVSAEVGTGTGRTPFGGTSGASPMVAGSAALLKQACRERDDDSRDDDSDDDGSDDHRSDDRSDGGRCSPLELKALLMNNAFRDVVSDTTGGLAEITRIGGGEVRVDAAAAATFWAYSPDDAQPSLGLGFVDADRSMKIRRRVEVVNPSDHALHLTVSPTFRFGDDAASGALKIRAPRTIHVPARGSKKFRVDFRIEAGAVPPNSMNSGSNGNNPAALSANELDGFVLLSGGGQEVALPWHVVARQAARVEAKRRTIIPGQFPDSIALENEGAGTAQNDAYTLIGVSDEMPRGGRGEQSPTPDIRAVGVTTFYPVSFCSSQFIWAFAVDTWDRQTHLVPVSHFIFLDIDRDGLDDYLVLNRDVTLNSVTDGRQLTWAVDLSTGRASAFFFAEHATNTGNTVLFVCGEQVGLSASDILARNVGVHVVAQDFYFGGPGDSLDGIVVTPFGEGFFGLPSGDLLPGGQGSLDVFDFGLFPGNSPELGVLLFTNGDRGPGARGGATAATEAQLFLAPGVTPPRPLHRPKRSHRATDDDHDDK